MIPTRGPEDPRLDVHQCRSPTPRRMLAFLGLEGRSSAQGEDSPSSGRTASGVVIGFGFPSGRDPWCPSVPR